MFLSFSLKKVDDPAGPELAQGELQSIEVGMSGGRGRLTWQVSATLAWFSLRGSAGRNKAGTTFQPQQREQFN